MLTAQLLKASVVLGGGRVCDPGWRANSHPWPQAITLTNNGASELSELMEGTTAGALIPEIVRRGFQDMLEAKVSVAIRATRHKRCHDECSNY